MAAPKKEAPRFESLPPEIRNMIYKHLFPPAELCKVRRLRQLMPQWDPQRQYVYIFHTAILRSNRLIGQEAKSVLYGSNILVHIRWDMQARDYHIANSMLPKVAFNRIPRGKAPPPCVVQIYHRVPYSKRRGFSIIVAAVDLHVICALILRRCSCSGCQPRASYSLAALPQLGWPRQRLLEMIWLPLKTLRGHGYYGSVKVQDSTGVFEQADNMSDWEKESEQESNTESDRINDTEEDESDENDSEDNESDELDSNDGEVEEDDAKSIGCAQNRSDEDDKAGDKSDEAATNKHRSNDPKGEPSNGPASIPHHDGDANAQIVAEDNTDGKTQPSGA